MNNNINNSTPKMKKSKRKFNIIDVLVVILIVAVISVAIYAVYAWSDIKSLWSKNVVELTYVVEFRNVDKEFVDNIESSVGTTVIDSVSKNSIGKVDSIESIKKYSVLDYEEKAEEKNDDTTTTVSYNGVIAEYPDRYNITVYIKDTAAEYQQDIGYTINGRRIAVGEIISVRFPEFSADAYCIGMVN